ncbi:MAG: HNH endonuclease [Roseiflexaceae bacterium]|nr:HNH endonuclease [Roseiflexaceae bacterium]
MARRNWQREELLLALNLYCRLPFGQYHSHNLEIIKLAGFIGRTSNAVAMKLSNFASFDPYHQSRGIKGLQNVSQADHDIWNEFTSNWDDLAIESEIIYAQLLGEVDVMKTTESAVNNETLHFSGSTEIERQVKVRLGQSFFRKVILTSYRSKCCVCGMPIPELLIASHIVPWRDDEHLRVNPHNGLCLCALHDKGFDRGFFTFGEDYKIVIGKTIRQYLPNSVVHNGFSIYEGQRITLPDKFIPDQRFLMIHRANYFLG